MYGVDEIVLKIADAATDHINLTFEECSSSLMRSEF